MAKSGGRTTTNLLRLSGMIYAAVGSFHVLRYFKGWEFRIGSFELTPLGSLLLGVFILSLSFACFSQSRR
ncbi:MAG: hypothetical protein HYZ52_00825 [Candidatus Omnitrophica bacterium]|nr:hypothetical protein [Candidatus Omnitrophota bacterium]